MNISNRNIADANVVTLSTKRTDQTKSCFSFLTFLWRFSADLRPEAVEGRNITAALSADGMRLAFVARGPGGKQQIARRLLNQPKATLLSSTENAVDPFSPDGQWIGFFADGKMKKISVQGGAAVALCDAPGASGGEDGSIIVLRRMHFTP